MTGRTWYSFTPGHQRPLAFVWMELLHNPWLNRYSGEFLTREAHQAFITLLESVA